MKLNLRGIVAGLIVLSLVIGAVPSVFASELDADKILELVDETIRCDTKVMSERMILVNSSGERRVREMQVQNKRSGDSDKMLVRFLAPADVEGTGFLMVDDDMWLYLPALGKVRRIAGHAKKGSFMGSDMSYEDMEHFGSTGFSADYAPILLGEEQVYGDPAYVLELKPKSTDGTYEKLKMWVSKKYLLPRQIHYFDRDGSLLKTLATDRIQNVDGRWVAMTVNVENVQKGSKTILEVDDVDFSAQLDDSVFTTRYLKRGR